VPGARASRGRAEVIEPSRPQLSFAEGLIQEEVGPLWEEWMREVDALLADRELVQIVYEALARRYPRSRTRGRPATPAEVVLRLLLLKHMRNWSYQVLEREVRANLTPRRSADSPGRSAPRSSSRSIGELSLLPARRGSFAAGGCGWIRRLLRLTSTTQPTAPCSAMGSGYSPAP
jgi:hypothetical protein